MFNIFRKIFGTTNDRIIKKLKKEIENINYLEQYYASLTDQSLRDATLVLKNQIHSNAKTLDDILYDAFAIVREASKRTLGKRHFDEQLIGGLILHRGQIVEMRTGEGKTLVATLPAFLNALSGKGVHIVTVNDYLATRDAAWMSPLFNFLGLAVGYVTSTSIESERRKAYECDITYATNNELGFDYLRDNMRFNLEQRVMRPFYYAIIDEVDSILIDEARTPLIISGPVNDRSDLYIKINQLIVHLSQEHYERDEKAKSINLNEAGIFKIEELLVLHKLIEDGSSLYDFTNAHLVHFINQALKAHILFQKNVDYLIKNDQLMIIDEFTGRILDGRRYSDGLHQSLEAKEGLRIQNENQTLASVTFQNYFRMYPKLSGMTGTAMTEAAEFKYIYNLDVVSVPPHRSVTRIDYDDEIYGTKDEKHAAILKLAKEAHAKGQPILVGTVSIADSEEMSQLFTEHKIAHKVLNAKFHEQEAHIIAQAGRFGAFTIATNMAGRGTDIMLGGNPEMLLAEMNLSDENQILSAKIEIEKQVNLDKEKVLNSGGLLVIGTKRHESRRIDNQLRGRSGRQGDPGATKFFLSLDDDLMRIFASERVATFLRKMGLKNGEALHDPLITRTLEGAQRKVEANNYEIRKNLLKFDDIMNEQRRIIYSQRNDIIAAKSIIVTIIDNAKDWVAQTVKRFIPNNSFREEWNLEGLQKEVEKVLSIKIDTKLIASSNLIEQDLVEMICQDATRLYQSKQQAFGVELFNSVAQYVILSAIDQHWKEHLHSLDHLRQGISLRAYGQKDPLNEYKKEAFNLFEQMLNEFSVDIIQMTAYLHVNANANVEQVVEQKAKERQTSETRIDPAFAKFNSGSIIETKLKSSKGYVDPKDRSPHDQETWGKILRNEQCPCNSGKKYKQCHGSLNKDE
jgi:preprotein translocase subunit SecA